MCACLRDVLKCVLACAYVCMFWCVYVACANANCFLAHIIELSKPIEYIRNEKSLKQRLPKEFEFVEKLILHKDFASIVPKVIYYDGYFIVDAKNASTAIVSPHTTYNSIH